MEKAITHRAASVREDHPKIGQKIATVKLSSLILTALLLIAPSMFADDRAPDWVKITDDAGWQPRDSSGEVVFRDRLWILGGWFNSSSAPPRDVWSSSNGKTWTLATTEAPWKHSDLPMTLAFGDKMWLMGGWYDGVCQVTAHVMRSGQR
jgi:hypothetical protein